MPDEKAKSNLSSTKTKITKTYSFNSLRVLNVVTGI